MDRIKIVGFRFEPRDIWLGVYHKEVFEDTEGAGSGIVYEKFYVCLIPMLPFIFIYYK